MIIRIQRDFLMHIPVDATRDSPFIVWSRICSKLVVSRVHHGCWVMRGARGRRRSVAEVATGDTPRGVCSRPRPVYMRLRVLDGTAASTYVNSISCA